MLQSVVVIEDEESIRDYVKDILSENNYSVYTAGDGATGLELINKYQPDLAIIDLGLPSVSGESVTLEIRKKFPDMLVIILTARDAVTDVINGLNLGADDYMTKPFVGDELVARVKARLRNKEGASALKVADLTLDTKTFEVKRNGKIIDLSPKEFKLLEYLMKNVGQVLTREMILNRIWLYSPDIETRVVDVYMGYLRKKIDSDNEKKLIQSIRGFGYTIKD
jgi:DNA-binding response OmpR family regulator